jgi:hypothetical protein
MAGARRMNPSSHSPFIPREFERRVVRVET